MDVIQLWWLSLAAFAAVVVVVALLLGLIVGAAKRIDRHASAIWVVGKQIAGNTVSIWLLEQTNEQVGKLIEETRALVRIADGIAAKLGRSDERGRR
jgi:hypothetical protein